jgi:hypothetical protein
MTKEYKMPYEIGVCKFNDGTYDVYPDLADIPPSTKYFERDQLIEKVEGMMVEILERDPIQVKRSMLYHNQACENFIKLLEDGDDR